MLIVKFLEVMVADPGFTAALAALLTAIVGILVRRVERPVVETKARRLERSRLAAKYAVDLEDTAVVKVPVKRKKTGITLFPLFLLTLLIPGCGTLGKQEICQMGGAACAICTAAHQMACSMPKEPEHGQEEDGNQGSSGGEFDPSSPEPTQTGDAAAGTTPDAGTGGTSVP